MKSIYICGSVHPSANELDRARYYTLKAHRLVATDWQVIASDNYGIDAHVAQYCERFSIPFHCYGRTARPRNGVSLRVYQRLDKSVVLSAHLVHEADTIICLNDLECRSVSLYACQLNKQVYIVGKTLTSSQMHLPG